MKHTVPAAMLRLALLASPALLGMASPALCADAEMQMWSCATMGERRPILYLAARGSRSYIKFQGQRFPATHELEDGGHRWTFGGNAFVLSAEEVAEYYPHGSTSAQGTFKCKLVSD